ncbi:Os05g0348700, partial [Oryza sativa Japonica Group]
SLSLAVSRRFQIGAHARSGGDRACAQATTRSSARGSSRRRHPLSSTLPLPHRLPVQEEATAAATPTTAVAAGSSSEVEHAR